MGCWCYGDLCDPIFVLHVCDDGCMILVMCMDIYYIMACSSLVFVKIWVSVTSLYVQGVGRDKLVSEHHDLVDLG